MYKGANVLVVGGAGFVGSNLIKRLLDLGANVTATIHRKDPQIQDPRVEYVRCELSQLEECKRVAKGQEYVFMVAANTSGAAVMATTPLVHVTPNLVMNGYMLEAAYEARVKKFAWCSSNTVYPVTAHPVNETEMQYGNLYDKYFFVAWMKQFCEVLCEMYGKKIKEPMHTVVLRPANIYGPYDDFAWETSHVVPALVRKVVERHKPISVWGDGKDIKDLIYIDNFVEGMLLAMERANSADPVNIGTGVPVSVRDVINHLIDVDGFSDAQIEYDASKPTMIPVRLIDCSKAERDFGFRAKTSLRDGLAQTVAWYRSTLR